MTAEVRQKLFNYFSQEHNISLLDNDFNEIDNIVAEAFLSEGFVAGRSEMTFEQLLRERQELNHRAKIDTVVTRSRVEDTLMQNIYEDLSLTELSERLQLTETEQEQLAKAVFNRVQIELENAKSNAEEWTSVEDLPDVGVKKLCFDGSRESEIAATLTTCTSSVSGLPIWQDDSGSFLHHVTHYKPLSKPPKQ